MDLAKIIQDSMAKNEAEIEGLLPGLYLTIPQANEIVRVHQQLQAENEKLCGICQFAYDIHTRDPANVKAKWGCCGARAEEKLCEMVEQALKEQNGK